MIALPSSATISVPTEIKTVQKGRGILSIKEILNHFENKKFSSYIISLLKLIKNNPILSWNEKANLLYKGRIVPNSDIIEIIKYILSKNTKSIPTGIEYFYASLAKRKVPFSLFINTNAKDMMRRYRKKQLTWNLPSTTF